MVIWLASASPSSQRYNNLILFCVHFLEPHFKPNDMCDDAFLFCILYLHWDLSCLSLSQWMCMSFGRMFALPKPKNEKKKNKKQNRPKFCRTVFNRQMCTICRSAYVLCSMFQIRYSTHVFGVRYLECHYYCIKCIMYLEIDLLSCLDSFKCLESVNPIPIPTNSVPLKLC